VPAVTAVTSPVCVTVATAAFDEAHAKLDGVASSGIVVAVSCNEVPATIDALDGESVIE
jgi:hypothetical protein